jgi:hypothetical protein
MQQQQKHQVIQLLRVHRHNQDMFSLWRQPLVSSNPLSLLCCLSTPPSVLCTFSNEFYTS